MASTNPKGLTKARQHLQLLKVAKENPSPLPYEITLHILEALIDMADDPAITLTWWLTYEHTVDTKLIVIDMQPCPSCKVPLKSSPLKDRFAKIRLPSQVNRQSRALVHRRFPRLYMIDDSTSMAKHLSPVLAWVQPQTDCFVPFFGSYQLEFAMAERFYKQAVVLPTPAGFEMLQHVQHLWLPSLDFLSGLNRPGLRALFRMPNLKDVTVDTTDLATKDMVMHPGRLPINEDQFPWLFVWYRHSAVFNRLWAEFNTRNVRLYAVVRGVRKKSVVIELFPTEAGIRMRYLHPNCTCCDHKAPKYSTIYHGEKK
ncbi:hypothetical protein LY78DRAFT_716942 [Colletotrichum sublineola]|uniref:Uncharacterized protein n=1 Tax=Colletotrichum sublineola TaxID=1173701 RepID=A0A066X6A7_COLSU|nr:hypothetical protein LY78DRAFT_716942 [Colletotrichum sublineola]KDN63174.1 hypothetical protein CSUB01_02122 [Colletotrichum sublineola]